MARVARFAAGLADGRRQVLDDARLGHDDLAFLQYIGGTTGVAKGTMLTDGNMVANVLQVGAWDVAKPQGRRGDRGHTAAAV